MNTSQPRCNFFIFLDICIKEHNSMFCFFCLYRGKYYKIKLKKTKQFGAAGAEEETITSFPSRPKDTIVGKENVFDTEIYIFFDRIKVFNRY